MRSLRVLREPSQPWSARVLEPVGPACASYDAGLAQVRVVVRVAGLVAGSGQASKVSILGLYYRMS